MVPQLLIFDCDGVLIDSEPVAARVFQEALATVGVAMELHDIRVRFTGFAEADARRICMVDLGMSSADVDSVFSEADDRLSVEFARSLTLMPGIAGIVEKCPVQKCVASNSGIDRLRNSLGLFELWEMFAPDIFSADMVAKPKPAPDLFQFCATKFDVAPARCIVIDDSPHGIVGAVTAGMTAIGFVDPADPRDGRQSVLAAAGAREVATGSAELSIALERIFARSGEDRVAEMV